jgi:4-hydroxy-3-methylbut-2-enyl diphosphate reductase
MEVVRHCRQGESVILIGHKGHPEVEGTMGQYQSSAGNGAEILLVETPDDVRNLTVRNPEKLAYVTQTTLSMDDTAAVIQALRERFPHICGPKKDDICYATQNRQDAVKHLAKDCDLILVVGSPNSSNSNRLRELAEKRGRPAYLIDGAGDIDRAWLEGVEVVGVTAGASAPEILVEQVVERLRSLGADEVTDSQGATENVVFVLPKNLRKLAERQQAAH